MSQANPTAATDPLAEVIDRLLERIDARAASMATPLLLDHEAAARFVGVSRAAWFRLVSADKVPPPVNVPGAGVRFRRQDLERWVEKLGRRRKATRPKAMPMPSRDLVTTADAEPVVA